MTKRVEIADAGAHGVLEHSSGDTSWNNVTITSFQDAVADHGTTIATGLFSYLIIDASEATDFTHIKLGPRQTAGDSTVNRHRIPAGGQLEIGFRGLYRPDTISIRQNTGTDLLRLYAEIDNT